MKKLVFALVLLFAGIAYASPTGGDGLMLNGVTATGPSATVITELYQNIDAQVWSASGSVATVTLECRTLPSAPWYPCQTVTNPDATGKYFNLARAYAYRWNVTAYSSGTIYASIVRYTD